MNPPIGLLLLMLIAFVAGICAGCSLRDDLDHLIYEDH